jgi:hypothetical protein
MTRAEILVEPLACASRFLFSQRVTDVFRISLSRSLHKWARGRTRRRTDRRVERDARRIGGE